jgi:sugar phosphate isomerase/epimerase
MQVGIFAKTFAGKDPLTVLKAAGAAGFHGVAHNMACSGLQPMPDEITQVQIAAIVAACRETGLAIQSLSGTYNMIHPDPQVRALGHRRLAVLAAAARPIGTTLITLCTGTRDARDQWNHHPDNSSPEAWVDLLKSFEVAVQIAEKHNIFLGVEPELANVVNSAAAARRLIDELQSDRIRIVLDPANLFETSPEPDRIVAQAVDLVAPHIAMAHAKDRDRMGRFATAGKGVVNFPHFLTCLRQVGFDGPLVTHGLTADEAPQVATWLKGLL